MLTAWLQKKPSDHRVGTLECPMYRRMVEPGIDGEVVAGNGPRLLGTNIDVTIGNRKARIRHWRVIDEGNSDHRLIMFNVGGERTRDRNLIRKQKGRLMVRTADWNEFDASLKGFMREERLSETIDDEVIDDRSYDFGIGGCRVCYAAGQGH